MDAEKTDEAKYLYYVRVHFDSANGLISETMFTYYVTSCDNLHELYGQKNCQIPVANLNIFLFDNCPKEFKIQQTVKIEKITPVLKDGFWLNISDEMIRCPYCLLDVPSNTLKCIHCHSDLSVEAIVDYLKRSRV